MGAVLNQKGLEAFNRGRKLLEPKSACYAPFISMNFDQTGAITACCFNRKQVLGTYPKNSVKEAWNGRPMRELREALKENDLTKGCDQCAKMLNEGNFESVLIRHFDDHAGLSEALKTPSGPKGFFSLWKNKTLADLMPVMFEFELSNHCNLECIMCGGKWSSAIRKNREKLPPLKSPYDADFVKQIRDFLPNLARANFLGGEPFLISVYYDIWDAIIELKPNIEVAITSNGTMLNNRAKAIVEKLQRCKVTLSIDSLRKDTWESIRLNGKFEELEENIDWLLKAGKLASFSVCPMIQNWKEMPEIMAFCEKHHLDIFFNIVYGPLGGIMEGVHTNGLYPEVSLQSLERAQLNEVIDFYQQQSFSRRIQTQLNNLISQLISWREQKAE
ncbi:MAG: twitch domain-containing radical SAM protein [Flavobacteriales bacterium]|nr:twitch domain-containing radical SAM protein [Flavobacteriales bacterium]